MSVHKDKVDQRRADVLKTVRAMVRLKYSLMADRELNDVLPEAERRFDTAVNRGRLPEVLEIKKAVES